MIPRLWNPTVSSRFSLVSTFLHWASGKPPSPSAWLVVSSQSYWFSFPPWSLYIEIPGNQLRCHLLVSNWTCPRLSSWHPHLHSLQLFPSHLNGNAIFLGLRHNFGNILDFYFSHALYPSWASQVAVLVNHPPASAGAIRDVGSTPG